MRLDYVADGLRPYARCSSAPLTLEMLVLARALALGTALALTGCAVTLPNSDWEGRDRVHLTPETLGALSGRYAYVGRAEQCVTAAGARCPTGFLGALDGLNSVREVEPGDTTAYLVLAVEDRDRIVATAYHGGRPIAEEVLKGWVNDRGYFQLYPSTRPAFTPAVVFWGLRSEGAQLGLAGDGAALVEYASSGVVFLVALPFFGSSHASTYTFQASEEVP